DRAASLCLFARGHDPAWTGERRRPRGGASNRGGAGGHPLAPPRPIAQRRAGRRHRARRGIAPNRIVSRAMSEDPAVFPPDPERCARADDWFAALRDRICVAYEAIEDEFASEQPEQAPP